MFEANDFHFKKVRGRRVKVVRRVQFIHYAHFVDLFFYTKFIIIHADIIQTRNDYFIKSFILKSQNSTKALNRKKITSKFQKKNVFIFVFVNEKPFLDCTWIFAQSCKKIVSTSYVQCPFL